MQGKKEYTEKLFTTFQLSSHVPADNFYRRLKAQLDLQWLYKSTKKYYGREGQASIDPVVFFKLILVGYLENLNSDRKIIDHSKMRLDILFFLGYDLDEELPWHSTISRTRGLYGEEVFKQLFSKVLSLCVSKKMLSGRRQAIDSAYIKANASMDSLIEKQIIEDGEHYLDELQHDDYGNPIEQHQNVMKDDRDSNTITKSRNASTAKHHNWKATEYKNMPAGKSIKKTNDDADSTHNNRPKFVSNHTHYSTTDRDARVSVKPGKPRQLNYSMQTSVDISSHLITNVEAHLADRRDSECLPQVLKNTIDNLKEQGLAVEEIAADTGYSSGKALQACAAQNITAYIPNFGQYKAVRDGFIYNEQEDHYACERGVLLPYKKTYQDKKGYYKKQYRSSAKDCAHCPLRTTCIGTRADYKKIENTTDKPLYDQMHQRLQTPYAKKMKKLRSSTVEPVLGTLINFMGVRRIWTRGLENAGKFMLGAAAAYNLKKWLNYNDRKLKTVVIALPHSINKLKKIIQRLCFVFSAACRYKQHHQLSFAKYLLAY